MSKRTIDIPLTRRNIAIIAILIVAAVAAFLYLTQSGPSGEMRIQALDIDATEGTINITLLNTGNTTLTLDTVLTVPPTPGSIYPYELDITCIPEDCTFEPGEQIRVLVEDLQIDPGAEYRVIARAKDWTEDSASALPHP